MIPCPAQTDVPTAPATADSLGMAATYWSTRRDLSEAPTALRTWLADALGGEPVSWRTAVGGFSPHPGFPACATGRPTRPVAVSAGSGHDSTPTSSDGLQFLMAYGIVGVKGSHTRRRARDGSLSWWSTPSKIIVFRC